MSFSSNYVGNHCRSRHASCSTLPPWIGRLALAISFEIISIYSTVLIGKRHCSPDTVPRSLVNRTANRELQSPAADLAEHQRQPQADSPEQGDEFPSSESLLEPIDRSFVCCYSTVISCFPRAAISRWFGKYVDSPIQSAINHAKFLLLFPVFRGFLSWIGWLSLLLLKPCTWKDTYVTPGPSGGKLAN